jgi:septum formation protein
MMDADRAWRRALTQAAGRHIILASASPRRKELLQRRGADFDVVVSGAPEGLPEGDESPEAYSLRSACEKALDVAARFPARIVLGADTVVTVDSHILGKPLDEADAAAMLRRLSGREHKVHTGCALAVGYGSHGEARIAESFVVTTTVVFRPLTEAGIAGYVASGEPLDKAGAYGIQGLAGRFVVSIDGSYDNVVGLPVDEVLAALCRLRAATVQVEGRGSPDKQAWREGPA